MLRLLSLVLFVGGLFFGVAQAAETLLIDDFETGLRPDWEVIVFQNKTRYEVVPAAGGHVLEAEAQASASGLILRREFAPQEWPVLSWRWKIADTLPGGDERQKATDDYAARIYVVFPHWFFPKTRSLNYIWANQLAQGASIPSPFTGNSIMLAARSGREQRGEWVAERHNLLEDYRRLFGEEPNNIGAIVIMTDADNTGGRAQAWYDDISLSSN